MIRKKILVTGGAGYIGTSLLIDLIENNYKPIVIDNLSNGKLSNIEAVENYTKQKITFYKADITNKKKITKIFQSLNNLYAVVHLASLKSINESLKMPGFYLESNINGLINIMSAMQDKKCFKIIFSSSASVYRSSLKNPFVENSDLMFKNPYSDSKIIIEKILESYSKNKTSWNICILRYFNPAGIHKSKVIKNFSSKKDSNLFEKINKVLKGEIKSLTIYKNKKNSSSLPIRDYIHINDLVLANMKALKNIERFTYEIFNIGSGKGYTVQDIINIYKKELNIHIRHSFFKSREGDEDYSVANIRKIKNKLGWRPIFTIRDICRDYI